MNAFQLKMHRFMQWEYWPLEVIYYPLFPIWLYLSIKARSFYFFNAANPSITNGGMAMESKKEIYDQIPSEFYPKTILIKAGTSQKEIIEKLKQSGIEYPLIVKPDIGLKALGVEKVENEDQLLAYPEKLKRDFLIQKLITFEKEIGLFYIREPHEKKGRVTGIVSKEFLKITGNGKNTVEELIKKNPRSHFQLMAFKKLYGSFLLEVLSENEEFILVPFGSHTRGAKFIDDSHQINESMRQVIDDICIQIPQFYFGRLDIRCSSIEDLSQGKNFSIIEINGSGSEPTHIYDPNHSIFFAWKEIIKYWRIMHRISITNHKTGIPYLTFKQGRLMFAQNALLEKHLKSI